MASNTTNATFGEEHGYNIQVVRGSTASWQYNLSHGAAYMEQPLRPSDEIHLTFSGSGHAEVGVSYRDPSTVPDKIMDCKGIVNVRLRKRETKEVVRYGQLGDVRIVSVQHHNGEIDECPVETRGAIWLMVNLKFGEVKVKIESSRGKVRFHPTIEENVKFITNYEQTLISTIDFNPGALCFIKERIRYQEGVQFTVSPIKDNITQSPPSNYFLKISYCNDNPVSHIKKEHYMSLDLTPTKNTLYHVTTLERSYCNEEQIHVGLTEGGLVHVRKVRSEDDYCVLPHKIDETACRSGIYIVLEPFRTRVVLSKIEDCQHVCTRGQVNLPMIPRAASYIKIVKRLDQIEHSMKHFEEEKSNVSKLVDGLEDDAKDYQSPIDYLTPTSVDGATINEREPSQGDENMTTFGEMTMAKIYEKMCRIETRMEEESKRNSSLQTNFDEYMMKIRDVVHKFENYETSQRQVQRPESTISPNDIKERIKRNAPKFIQALDLFPLCDFLLSDGVINFEKYSDFLEKSKQSRTDANREFMMLLLKGLDQQPHIWDCVLGALTNTKQEHLIS
ncbi:hypothetical protein FSP39_009279 [Pinctada imbricata]|uniref:Uncharacterized protein n=1 Tax=Pinctada imbricata TaxID=66713 RepID=A0AA88Y619_PINIB|nr:hypothetical protein FSP39_009279 [Pinctada imbricata]